MGGSESVGGWVDMRAAKCGGGGGGGECERKGGGGGGVSPWVVGGEMYQ